MTRFRSLAAITAWVGAALALAPHPASAQIATVKIQSLEGSGMPINAQFNPTELSIDKQVPWQKKKKSSGDEPTLGMIRKVAHLLRVEA